MFDWITALQGLVLMLGLGFLTWLASLLKQDVSIVDSVWSLFFFGVALLYFFNAQPNGPRSVWVLALVGLWAVRLCAYLTWRNWGKPEDRRYQAIRSRNQPNFPVKSLWLVFFLQALLAWVVALPILPALKSGLDLGPLDGMGIVVILFGLGFESLADWQMAVFKAKPENQGRVMDRGLWGYSRHPNYFGEFSLWWGVYLLAISAGAPVWVLVSPLLMSFLLLKVSGIPLLENDLQAHRPAYRDYQNRTSAFFPSLPKKAR